jgi:dTDP-4-dehydrorhamnose 3,5-epimerase
LQIEKTNIHGAYLISPDYFKDSRGEFMETFNQRKFEDIHGEPISFLQDNQSVSRKYTLRGLHYQKGEYAQAKLVRVITGRVKDVVVDIREGSQSYGAYFSVELSGENRKILFIPKGLAHGFLALEDNTIFAYKCDSYYNAEAEGGIIYNDPDLAIDWGIPPNQILLSEKDRQLSGFKDLWV